MTQDEFIKTWVGVPWVDRGTTIEGIDCWGLVGAYFREMFGVELTKPIQHPEINTGFNEQMKMGLWKEVDRPKRGVFFTSFRGDRATHCGVILNSMTAIHSHGGNEVPGSVAVHSIRTIRSVYGEMRFFEWRQ